MDIFGVVKDSLENKYGTRIMDYIERDGNNKKWKKLSVDRDDLIQNISSLQDQLDLIPLSQLDVNDELVWINSINGDYSVKTGYNAFFDNSQTEFNWSRIWMTELTPKINFFIWLALRG
ncbi:hypothetical protein KI387_021012, partial [Taxus chinensis]